MPRTAFPFAADDISAFARHLNGQLAASDHPPGHVELLNMLARAAGFRNFQHFRAQATAQDRLEAAPAVADPVDHQHVERVARHFDDDGRLTRWPAKLSQRGLCLWGLWSRLPSDQVFSEQGFNQLLKQHHLFGDPASLRRELHGDGLIYRTDDCREYRRIERKPPADALALIRILASRQAA